jgi:hypothetical protein
MEFNYLSSVGKDSITGGICLAPRKHHRELIDERSPASLNLTPRCGDLFQLGRCSHFISMYQVE